MKTSAERGDFCRLTTGYCDPLWTSRATHAAATLTYMWTLLKTEARRTLPRNFMRHGVTTVAAERSIVDAARVPV